MDRTKVFEFNCTYLLLFSTGTSVDWEVSLQVGSAGPTHLLPPGWYIEDPRDSILLGHLPINGLDEWDVAKLGKIFKRFSRPSNSLCQKLKG